MNRPVGIQIYTLILVFTAIGNGLRLVEAIFFWKTLGEFHANATYITVSGGIWMLAALFLVIGTWSGKTWAWVLNPFGVIGYVTWYWLDRLFLQFPRANWPFALIITVMVLIFFTSIYFTKNTRLYFKHL
jgi:hypothetical protein